MSAEKIKTILLVEDEAITALVEKKILEKYDYHVIIENSGEKGISTVATVPDIDLILMDIDLGDGIDGTIAAQRILELNDLPLIFLSSHTEPEVVKKTEGITSYGYIVKNSGATVLVESIKMAFRLFDSKIKEKNKEEALLKKMGELQRFHQLTVGRELTMIDLKKEVNSLLVKSGENEKYVIIESREKSL